MAGTIVYVSFPRFTRKRQSAMSAICHRIIEALMTLSGMSSCFSRPDRALKLIHTDVHFEISSQPKIVTRHSLMATRTDDACPTIQHTSTAPYHTTSLSEEDKLDPSALTRRTSSEYSTQASSLRSVSSKLRAGLKRRISSWRSDRSEQCPVDDAEAVASDTGITTSDEDIIAGLDVLALSQHERELLGRIQQVCHSARIAQDRRHGRWEFENDWEGSGLDEFAVGPRLRLRGGGGDDEDVRPFRTPRRRTTLPLSDPIPPQPDSTRPHRVLWWLAGGRKGHVPTAGELRVRKEVEQANRKIVGFWGTVLGVRRVGRVGILPDGSSGDAGVDAGRNGSVLGDAEVVSTRRSASADSIAEAGQGGGSLVGSRGEQEVEVEHPIETKVKSVASVDDGAGHAKLESADGTSEHHGKSRSGSIVDAGNEDPKTEAESAKSVAGTTGNADVESVRSGGGAAEAVGESKARSSEDD